MSRWLCGARRLAAIVAVAAALLPVSTSAERRDLEWTDDDASRGSLLQAMNEQRARRGLPPLRRNVRLDEAAADRIRDMFEFRYFAHVAPDGTEPPEVPDVTRIEVVSSQPDRATGPDARVRVVPARGVEAADVRVALDGRDVTGQLPVVGRNREGLLVGLVEVVPVRVVMLAGQARFDVGPQAHREHRGGDDPVDRRLVELVDQVEVVERLDLGRAEAGLLGQLPERAGRDPLARLECARDALPQARQDAAG